MFRSLLIILTLFGSIQLKAGPTIQFESLIYSYGDICYNTNPGGIFHFKNTGDEPLVLISVKTSCGCLVGSWSREPVMPGESGTIKCKYDTKRLGPINKSITVKTNDTTNSITVLRIKGKVSYCTTSTNIESDTIPVNLGKIDLLELKSVKVEFSNTGDEYLALLRPYNRYYSDTLPEGNGHYNLILYQYSPYPGTRNTYRATTLYPGSNGYVEVSVRNTAGKQESFVHYIPLKLNTEQQYILKVTGEFINNNPKKTHYWDDKQNRRFHYSNGTLEKIEYRYNEKVIKTVNFKDQ